MVSVAGIAQGTVTFANASSVGWANTTFDRLVRWGPGASSFNAALTEGGLVSSNQVPGLTSLRAALYYAASSDNNLADFVAASGGPETFKNSTSATVGSWFGHTDTLDTIPNGTTANLVVFVWDTSVNADPRLAGAAGGLYGASAIFQYTPPTNPMYFPTDFLMYNLTSFTVGLIAEPSIPEPTTIALVGLGAAALLVLRRKK
jgi:hypothetical protein